MKALFLFLLCTISVASLAQNNIVIHLDGQSNDISGQTHTVVALSPEYFDIPFDVINNTGAAAQWRITRKQLSVPTGWTDRLCWGHSTDPFGGTCYSSSQMNTNPWTSPGTQSELFTLNDGEYGKMKITIDPEDNTFGQAHYRFYITPNGLTMLDSVDLVVDYIAASKPILKEELSITVAPNPSTEYVNIQFSGADQLHLKMVDALGNVITREVLTSNRKINVSDLNSGVYFLVFEASGAKSITRKLVVRH
jgi:Secretion system C-terminal sorting domain